MLPGMPRLSSGIRLAPTTAELALSVAAMPCRLPLPKLSGSREACLAEA
jgi:hypothetical protein